MGNAPRIVRSASLLVLLAGLQAIAVAFAQDSSDACPAPCDLSEVAPVCGSDGITYQSSCLALCQGVRIARKRACKPNEGGNFAPANAAARASQAPTVDLETMQRYKAEGFSFVGVAKTDPNFQPRKMTATTTARKPMTPRQLAGAVRFEAATGFMYATTAAGSPLKALLRSTMSKVNGTSTAGAAAAEGFYPAFNPDEKPAGSGDAASATVASEAAGLGRKLLEDVVAQTIFGTDDRVRVTPTSGFPWRTAGLVQFTLPGKTGTYGCSGAMVSPTSFITAAHCVHGGKGGAWASSILFSPGADGGARPFGTIAWETATTYSAWINNGCNADACPTEQFYYDLAVVRLSTAVGAAPTNLGWLGLAISDTFTNVPVTTSGYPGDKPPGTMWRAQCSISDSNPADFITNTMDCDTMGGQSGSAVWQQDANTVRAVVSHGNSVSNGFIQITTDRFWDVISWMGGSFTPWNDAGSLDRWQSVYLDRHVPGEFCNNLQALQSFRLEIRPGSSPAQMRVRYQCDGFRGVTGAAALRYVTPTNDFGGGNTVFFDRHNIACPPNQVLRNWRLIRPTVTAIAFEYFCTPANIAPATCVQSATAWNTQGGGQVQYLDRHAPACPSGRVLTQWRLENNHAAGQYRIAFTCCGR